jgi:hypothetical protein
MKNIFLLIFACIAFSSCKKDTFDEASFRCKINGNEFFASSDQVAVTYTEATGTIDIRGSKVNLDTKSLAPYGDMKFDITIPDPANGSTISLDSINTYLWSNNGDQNYRSSKDYPGTLTISEFDTDSKTIKATFSLSAYTANGTFKEITEGKLDINWGDL